MVKHFCAMIEDGNPSYWDDDVAEDIWGSPVAPPAMLLTWCMPLAWTPTAAHPVPPLALRVPLPGETVINVSQEAEFFQPVRIGDLLSMVEVLLEVSDSKTTALGVGHFVTTEMTFSRQDATPVAVMTNVLFRFSAHVGGGETE
jgi:acyl dehydratase